MVMRRVRRPSAHLVTEAQRSKSADISYRGRRYLIMMAIRVVCFVVAVIVFANGGGWLTAIPAVGAIAIPYFAVVFANGGREPSNTQGFRAYEPNLPPHYPPPVPFVRLLSPRGPRQTKTPKVFRAQGPDPARPSPPPGR